jgi:hypothetical protein
MTSCCGSLDVAWASGPLNIRLWTVTWPSPLGINSKTSKKRTKIEKERKEVMAGGLGFSLKDQVQSDLVRSSIFFFHFISTNPLASKSFLRG